MSLLEKILFFITVCMFAGMFIQAILLLKVLFRKPHNVVIPRYEIARQKIRKAKAGGEYQEEDWVYVDNEGFLVLNWRNLRADELDKLHYIPVSQVYNFQFNLNKKSPTLTQLG